MKGLERQDLIETMPAGAARNALDCALWDFEAKAKGVSVAEWIGVPLAPVMTTYTISLGTPEQMAAQARKAEHFPILKLKLGGAGDSDRLRAVRAELPEIRLIVDANEAWAPQDVARRLELCAGLDVELVEQPLPPDDEDLLSIIPHHVPVCADESAHTADEIPHLATLYDAVNIKLDKSGGLTTALEMSSAARQAGLKIMIGSMVGTSLAMAPAVLLAQDADYIDLDGPLLLNRDRTHGLVYTGAMIEPPSPLLWG